LTFFNELKRRNVFRVAIGYIVSSWILLQVADLVLNNISAPDWVIKTFMLVIALGFPVVVFFSWAYEVTPEGIKRESEVDRSQSITHVTGRKLDYSILAVLLIALAYFAYDKFVISKNVDAARIVNTIKAESEPSEPEAAPTQPDKSIAVLPFVNMSGDPEQEYFSDGIAEELLNRLAQLPDLKVAARTSAFQFKGKNLDIADIGRQLNVAHVLEGSVRKGGTTLRITAQLIDSQTGFHLWSDTYDRDASDILKVQDEIAGAITTALQYRLGASAIPSVPVRKVNPAAYDDYLQGRAFVAKRWLDNLDKAINVFDRAIAKDPEFSAAYSGRAFAYSLRPLWGAPVGNTLAIARDSAEQALLLDPGNAEAFMVRGMVAAYSRNATSARADLDRAQTLAPGSVDVLNMDGDFHLFFGSLDEGERLKRLAMELDPLSFVHPLNMADNLLAQGRFKEAITMAEQAIALGGATTYSLDRAIVAYARAGLFEQAKAALEQQCAQAGNDNNCEGNRALLLAASGQRQQAETILDDLVRDIRTGKRPLGNYNPAYLASLYLEVSDIHKTSEMLNFALDQNDWFPTNVLVYAPGGSKLPEEISTDPQWLAVWADPRLEDVINVYRQNLLAWRARRPLSSF
jgi:TolB-like protein